MVDYSKPQKEEVCVPLDARGSESVTVVTLGFYPVVDVFRLTW